MVMFEQLNDQLLVNKRIMTNHEKYNTVRIKYHTIHLTLMYKIQVTDRKKIK